MNLQIFNSVDWGSVPDQFFKHFILLLIRKLLVIIIEKNKLFILNTHLYFCFCIYHYNFGESRIDEVIFWKIDRRMNLLSPLVIWIYVNSLKLLIVVWIYISFKRGSNMKKWSHKQTNFIKKNASSKGAWQSLQVK